MRIKVPSIGFHAFRTGKQKPPQYVAAYGLDKTSVTEAGTANRIIDDVVGRTIAGSDASGESSPLSKRTKPAVRRPFAAEVANLPQQSALSVMSPNDILDACISYYSAKAAK